MSKLKAQLGLRNKHKIFRVVLTVVVSFLLPSATAENSRNTNELQKLLLDVFSGKQVGPSGDKVVETKYELNKTAIVLANERVPIRGIYQGGASRCVPVANDLLTKDTDDAYVIIVRAARLRPLINLGIWTCSMMFVLQRTPSMQRLSKPSYLQLFPYRTLPLPVIVTAINQAGTAKPCPIVDGRYGEMNGVENRLWYFRDDIELNSQHWFWHLIYPYYLLEPRPDRRGELFYYLHQQLIARYNTERLANDLPLAKPFKVSSNSIISEQYFPYISHRYTGQYWPSRQANTPIDYNGKLGQNIPEHVEMIYAAIDAQAITSVNGNTVSLNNLAGIDVLEDIVESSVYSLDRKKYGVIHNNGHEIISYLGNSTESFNGAMLDLATSIRDPAFFRWHSFLNDLFDRHKKLLKPYSLTKGNNRLIWEGIKVDLVSVQSNTGLVSVPALNALETMWSYRKLDISQTISTDSTPPLPVCLKYLNHRGFDYHITISSNMLFAKATVRIYLAPRYNVDHKRFKLKEQRRLFFLLDTFTTKLTPGENFINRSSKDTTVTKPLMKTFAELEREVANGRVQKPQCGCGLPHNLLLPRGTPAGMVFDLFVYVTDGERDADANFGDQSKNFCTAPFNWCGRPGQKYPDKKPMGYPFDRLPPFTASGSRVRYIEDFSDLIPNSKTIQVIVTHKDD